MQVNCNECITNVLIGRMHAYKVTQRGHFQHNSTLKTQDTEVTSNTIGRGHLQHKTQRSLKTQHTERSLTAQLTERSLTMGLRQEMKYTAMLVSPNCVAMWRQFIPVGVRGGRWKVGGREGVKRGRWKEGGRQVMIAWSIT